LSTLVRRTALAATFAALRICPAAADVEESSQGQGPVITVEAPTALDAMLIGPVQIAVRWSAQNPASINLESLRIKYKLGFATKDITKTVLAAMRESSGSRLDAEGLFVPNANLPPGRHRLVVELSDSLQRRSQAELEFHVAKR
jgi:hypothetical protein